MVSEGTRFGQWRWVIGYQAKVDMLSRRDIRPQGLTAPTSVRQQRQDELGLRG